MAVEPEWATPTGAATGWTAAAEEAEQLDPDWRTRRPPPPGRKEWPGAGKGAGRVWRERGHAALVWLFLPGPDQPLPPRMGMAANPGCSATHRKVGFQGHPLQIDEGLPGGTPLHCPPVACPVTFLGCCFAPILIG